MPLIPDQLRWAAGNQPDEPAFVVDGIGAITYAEWHATSSRLAHGLIDAGIKAGDRVALVMRPEDGLAFVQAYSAIHKAGGVAVPVNTRMAPSLVEGVLAHCEPTVTIVADELTQLAPGGIRWDTLLADDAEDIQVDRDSDDLAEILYTSGTTSAPKGVAIRHSNSAMIITSEPQWTGRPWLHACPMFTFSGMTFVYQPMRMGMFTLYLPKFDTGAWLRLIAEAQPKSVFLVPAMVELLLADPRTATSDWSCVEMVSVGSAPIAPSTMLALQELVPDALVTNSYSMTEAGTAYFFMPKGQLATHPGSVGLAVPPAKVRIVDDEGADVAVGEIGNVQVKPAGKLREYYKVPAEKQEIFHADGWLRTGDLGKFDDESYLYIVGRAKDVIIRGGLNVHAVDVESALYEHPAVREAAVVGVEHPVLGEDVVAFVVLAEEGAASADELIAWTKERVADYAAPRRLYLVDEFPRNATGKVLKRELQHHPALKP
ncbi:MAG TPA: AMP-binding protein [Mycobacteriales bacterium]|jgi:acyl-CoA synthetase (AMP-forming)/AMP-acid ligase II|nr:AMP-binding protein [Mycobacteriales bacterium]